MHCVNVTRERTVQVAGRHRRIGELRALVRSDVRARGREDREPEEQGDLRERAQGESQLF